MMTRGRFYLAQVEAIERQRANIVRCSTCRGEMAAGAYRTCESCREKAKERTKGQPPKRWVPNPDITLKKPRRLCKRCGVNKPAPDTYKYCESCREDLRDQLDHRRG